MYIPKWLLAILLLVLGSLSIWCLLMLTGRNPLPFPDNGSRIFSTPSAEAKSAIVDLLARHGVKERFQANSENVQRSIMWDGTIINQPTPESLAKLDQAQACIGLVADDPTASAHEAAKFLQDRGFEARVVLDIEPDLPIAFV
ncbi:MAG TPA: hypothetical protein PKY96_05545, partial [Flavobacteriales bacterium]|nr:hypothetical protein [Flavobacteriales bacterium]